MKRFRKIGVIVLVTIMVLVGVYITPILAAPNPSFNYTITATGTEDVTTYPDQPFSWTVTVTGTERYTYQCGSYCCERDWLGNCVSWCPEYCTGYATRSYTRTGTGVVNATEGLKLISNLYLPPPAPQRGGYIYNISRTVTDNNPTVGTSLSCFGSQCNLNAITSYSEIVAQPWSGTEEGSASVNVADGDKYITTSTLVAPNGDTAWSVSNGCDCVNTWMVGPELYAAVADSIPPVINISSVNPDVLWPPNHKMVQVTGTVTVTDNCDPAPVVAVTVDSNEPINAPGVGDGNTEPDWYIDEDGNLWLRAERDGTGTDRIYTITITATDALGNSGSAQATVTVPHDQKNKNK